MSRVIAAAIVYTSNAIIYSSKNSIFSTFKIITAYNNEDFCEVTTARFVTTFVVFFVYLIKKVQFVVIKYKHKTISVTFVM